MVLVAACTEPSRKRNHGSAVGRLQLGRSHRSDTAGSGKGISGDTCAGCLKQLLEMVSQPRIYGKRISRGFCLGLRTGYLPTVLAGHERSCIFCRAIWGRQQFGLVLGKSAGTGSVIRIRRCCAVLALILRSRAAAALDESEHDEHLHPGGLRAKARGEQLGRRDSVRRTGPEKLICR